MIVVATTIIKVKIVVKFRFSFFYLPYYEYYDHYSMGFFSISNYYKWHWIRRENVFLSIRILRLEPPFFVNDFEEETERAKKG